MAEKATSFVCINRILSGEELCIINDGHTDTGKPIFTHVCISGGKMRKERLKS